MNEGSDFLGLLPFFIVSISIVIWSYCMSKNMGLKTKKYIYLSFIPIIGYFVPLLILSNPNQKVLDKLNKIEELLNNKN